MKRRSFFDFRFFSFLAIFVILLFSCDHFHSDSDSSGGVGEKSAYLSISVDGMETAARNTINPSEANLSDLTNLKLTGLRDSEEKTLAEAEEWASFGTKIEVATGTWESFTLSATLGGATYTATNSNGAKGFYIEENSTTAISFDLKADSEGTGTLSFTLNLPDESVKSAKATLRATATSEITEITAILNEKTLTISQMIASGSYRLAIILYGDESKSLELNTYKAAVNIAPGRTSTGSDSLTSLNEIYSITFEKDGGEFADSVVTPESYTRRSEEITLPQGITKSGATFMGWYEKSDFSGDAVTKIAAGNTGDKTFYAKWLSTAVYVSSSGNDTNDGLAEDRAVATLEKAASLVSTYATEYELTDKGWTIFISGTVKGNQNISGEISAASIAIEGVSGANTDILDGEQNGTVLSIKDTTTPITIEKLKITNGKSTSSGAGISIVGGNLTLGHGVLISGNECTENGGGVWNSKSTLLVKVGTEISGNTTTKNGGGIYNCYDSTLTLEGGKISGNTAENGGGIYNNMITGQIGTVFIYGSTIIGDETATGAADSSNNSNSAKNGGGIYNVGSLYLGYLDENTEAGFTGGIFYNYASESGGGGVYNTGTLTMSGGTIGWNAANGKSYDAGGGVCVAGGTFTMTGGFVTGNRMTTSGYAYGGGVGVERGSFVMGGTAVIGSIADTGSGGVATATAHSNYVGGDSGSSKYGGGLYVGSGCKAYIGYKSANENDVDSSFTGGIGYNFSANRGGGISVGTGGTLYLASGTIAHNGAATNGGGVSNSGTFTMSGSAVIASDNDVYLPSGKTITVGGALIEDAPVATITPASYEIGRQVLDGTEDLIASECGKFAVTENPVGTAWRVSAKGNLYKAFDAILYVDGTSGNESNNALSESTAVKTLTRAVSLLKEYASEYGMSGDDWKIYLKNTVSGGTAVELNEENAASLTIEGLQNSEASSDKDFLVGTSEAAAITLTGSTPVTFYKVCVTGGKGGIVAAGTGTVTVKNAAIMNNTGSGIKIEGNCDVDITATLIGGTDSTNGNTYGGSGGGIYKGGSGTLTIKDSTIAYNTVDLNGGGIMINSGDVVLSDSVNIHHNGSKNGAGIYKHGSGTLTTSDTTISDNTTGTSSNGGGIYVNAGDVTLGSGTKVQNNTATVGLSTGGSGGGIYKTGNGTLTITGGEISGNTATTTGGGIYVNAGNVTLGAGSKIQNNTASSGGGGGVYSTGTLTMSGGTIGWNTANGASYDSGGGVCVAGGTFTMTGGFVTGNRMTTPGYAYGGGVGVKGGSFVMGGTAVIGSIENADSGDVATATAYSNYVGGDSGSSKLGGGLSVRSSGTAYIGYKSANVNDVDSDFEGGIGYNFAAYMGGGIFVESGTVYLAGGTIARNGIGGQYGGGIAINSSSAKVVQSGGTIANNNGSHGGGVNVYSGSYEMSGGSITKNTASQAGAGVYIEGTFTMTGGDITGNLGDGGNGVQIGSRHGKFTMSGGEISGNAKQGIFQQYAGTLEISGSAKVSGNFGGGVQIDKGSFTMSGGEISGNTKSGNGAGVYLEADATMTMSGGTISGNTPSENSSISGGGIYNGGTLTMTGGTISGNTGYRGGGIATGGSSTLTMTGGTISNNTATGQGGGVSNSGTFTMSGTAVIDNNKSLGTTYGGGGIYAPGTSITIIEGGTISNNTSAADGGGIYMVNSANLTIKGGSITTNTANDSGGGVYFDSSTGTFTMTGGTIGENTAKTVAGGVFTRGTFTMTGGKITENMVTGSSIDGSGGGAGLYIAKNATVTMSGGEISGNKITSTKTTGGGVYNLGTFTMNGTAVISGNKALGTTGGGGIYAASASTTIIESGTISNNEAASYGGGIYTVGSAAVTMTGGTISKNHAGVNGGGIYKSGNADGNLFKMTGGLVTENTADGKGSGIDLFNGDFQIGGSAQVAQNNLLFMNFNPEGTATTPTLSVIGTLTESAVATITLSDGKYTAGTQVLDGTAALLASEHGKFAVDESGWIISSDGTLHKQVSGGITISVPTYSNKDINLQQTAETADSLTFTVDSGYTSYLWTVGGTVQSTTNTLTLSKSIVSTAGVWIMAVASDSTGSYEAKIFLEAQ